MEKDERLLSLQSRIRQLLNTNDVQDFIKAKELQKEASKLLNEIFEIKTFTHKK